MHDGIYSVINILKFERYIVTSCNLHVLMMKSIFIFHHHAIIHVQILNFIPCSMLFQEGQMVADSNLLWNKIGPKTSICKKWVKFCFLIYFKNVKSLKFHFYIIKNVKNGIFVLFVCVWRFHVNCDPTTQKNGWQRIAKILNFSSFHHEK